MPRRLPLYVERNFVKGKTYLSFRRGKGPRIRLPDDPTTAEFLAAYQAALMGETAPIPAAKVKTDARGTIGALIVSYKRSARYAALRKTSKAQYDMRLELIREAHGHRTVSGMTRKGILKAIMEPLSDRPGAALDTLKKLRVLIRHAMDMEELKYDPSVGIERPKTKEIRAWTDQELKAFEDRWPLGTKQRTAYSLMLYLGAARVDVHRITWPQIEDEVVNYERSKTGVAVHVGIAAGLRQALAAWPRTHVTVINTAFGKPFTIDGYSRFMRDAITAAGLPLSCQPHGLRKTLGRKLADSGVSANDIMATLGHKKLGSAELYTREADRRRGGRTAIEKLEDHRVNKVPQTASLSLGKQSKKKGKST